jgi:hypothetical protein
MMARWLDRTASPPRAADETLRADVKALQDAIALVSI